jgi:hypothetical protein
LSREPLSARRTVSGNARRNDAAVPVERGFAGAVGGASRLTGAAVVQARGAAIHIEKAVLAARAGVAHGGASGAIAALGSAAAPPAARRCAAGPSRRGRRARSGAGGGARGGRLRAGRRRARATR